MPFRSPRRHGALPAVWCASTRRGSIIHCTLLVRLSVCACNSKAESRRKYTGPHNNRKWRRRFSWEGFAEEASLGLTRKKEDIIYCKWNIIVFYHFGCSRLQLLRMRLAWMRYFSQRQENPSPDARGSSRWSSFSANNTSHGCVAHPFICIHNVRFQQHNKHQGRTQVVWSSASPVDCQRLHVYSTHVSVVFNHMNAKETWSISILK